MIYASGTFFLTSINACDLTINKAVEQCIAANAIRAMDAAGNFSDRIKARNHTALPIKYLRLGIAGQTSHRMVNSHARVAGPERTVLDFLNEIAGIFAKIFILALVNKAVVTSNALLETFRINSHLDCDFLKRRRSPCLVDLDALFDRLVNS